MDVVDTKKLETAIIYLQRMTEGNNPVNNMPADDDSVINNPNVLRCMEFVKEVLEELKRNDGYIGRRPRNNKDSNKNDYPMEVLKDFQYTGDKTITKLVEQINSLADMTKYKRITYNPITAWLKENGYLKEDNIEGRINKCTMVTEKGHEIGIMSELRIGARNEKYIYILYGKSAQEFIVTNLEKILKKQS
ncbi:MAG: hypothetical protein K6B68_10820 [Eubacterium sp.]|nr:hypothetical protein [Eubacterium sp.]